MKKSATPQQHGSHSAYRNNGYRTDYEGSAVERQHAAQNPHTRENYAAAHHAERPIPPQFLHTEQRNRRKVEPWSYKGPQLLKGMLPMGADTDSLEQRLRAGYESIGSLRRGPYEQGPRAQAPADHSHLRLGITQFGMLRFLARINLLVELPPELTDAGARRLRRSGHPALAGARAGSHIRSARLGAGGVLLMPAPRELKAEYPQGIQLAAGEFGTRGYFVKQSGFCYNAEALAHMEALRQRAGDWVRDAAEKSCGGRDLRTGKLAGCNRGHIAQDGPLMLANVIGYDVLNVIKNFLRERGWQRYSVCEIILTQPEFADMRNKLCVRQADVFFSHVQGEPFLGLPLSFVDPATGHPSTVEGAPLADPGKFMSPPASTMGLLDQAVRPGGVAYAQMCEAHKCLPQNRCGEFEPAIWLDYFCLRQEQNDFDVHRVVGLIGEIPLFMAAHNQDYTNRACCVVELFGAYVMQNAHRVNAGTVHIQTMTNYQDEMALALEVRSDFEPAEGYSPHGPRGCYAKVWNMGGGGQISPLGYMIRENLGFNPSEDGQLGFNPAIRYARSDMLVCRHKDTLDKIKQDFFSTFDFRAVDIEVRRALIRSCPQRTCATRVFRGRAGALTPQQQQLRALALQHAESEGGHLNSIFWGKNLVECAQSWGARAISEFPDLMHDPARCGAGGADVNAEWDRVEHWLTRQVCFRHKTDGREQWEVPPGYVL